jgi:hypothetical protein
VKEGKGWSGRILHPSISQVKTFDQLRQIIAAGEVTHHISRMEHTIEIPSTDDVFVVSPKERG